MKQIVLRNGLISGVIIIVLMLVMSLAMKSTSELNSVWGMVVGFATMLLALSLVFFGVRQVRDKENNGSISFLEALKVGFFIGIISVAFYVVSWLIYHQLILPDFAENYVNADIAMKKEMGMDAAELAKYEAEMLKWVERYNTNVFYRIYATAMEIFPVMVLVTLISALILKRKPKANLEMKGA